MEDGVGIGEEEQLGVAAGGGAGCAVVYGVYFACPVGGAGGDFDPLDAWITGGSGAEAGEGVIGAAIEGEDDGEIRVILLDETVGDAGDDLRLVVGGDDDANARGGALWCWHCIGQGEAGLGGGHLPDGCECFNPGDEPIHQHRQAAQRQRDEQDCGQWGHEKRVEALGQDGHEAGRETSGF